MSKAVITIQFKPEFELKLKRLRIKGKFIKELRMHLSRESLKYIEGKKQWIHVYSTKVDMSTHRTMDSAIFLNGLKSWKTFIFVGFFWNETEDGIEYWKAISKK